MNSAEFTETPELFRPFFHLLLQAPPSHHFSPLLLFSSLLVFF